MKFFVNSYSFSVSLHIITILTSIWIALISIWVVRCLILLVLVLWMVHLHAVCLLIETVLSQRWAVVLFHAKVLRRNTSVTTVLAGIFRGKTAVVHASHFKVISKRWGSKRTNLVDVRIDAVDIRWHHELHIETILMITLVELLWRFCLIYIWVVLWVISNVCRLFQLAILVWLHLLLLFHYLLLLLLV